MVIPDGISYLSPSTSILMIALFYMRILSEPGEFELFTQLLRCLVLPGRNWSRISKIKVAQIKPTISSGILGKIDIRVGAINVVDDVRGSDKLVKLIPVGIAQVEYASRLEFEFSTAGLETPS